MATSRGIELAHHIRQKVAALKQVCEEVDENVAGQAPSDRGLPSRFHVQFHIDHLREILAALSGNK